MIGIKGLDEETVRTLAPREFFTRFRGANRFTDNGGIILRTRTTRIVHRWIIGEKLDSEYFDWESINIDMSWKSEGASIKSAIKCTVQIV